MPGKGADGLGYISTDASDLFRPLVGPLANRDPVELKPPYRVVRAAQQALEVDYYPIGILCVQIRVPGESIASDAIAGSEYMKWAIVESLAESVTRIGKVRVHPSSFLACGHAVDILEVQMPYLGNTLWQFCEFRFDFKLKVKSEEEAARVVHSTFVRMVDFEADFCKTLEFKFREIYHLTVMKLINKRFTLLDGKEISDQVALFSAAQDNNLNKIETLIKQGVDVNAFQKAARYPAELLDEDNRFLVVNLGRTPLLGAAEEGHIDAMKLLLEAAANVNFQDNSGFHALYLAAGVPEVAEKAVNFLLANGADLNRPTGSGYTPLHNACGCGEAGGIQALIEARADLNLKSKSGAAPVHVAVINNQAKALETLAEFKANLDMPAFGGNTPMHEGVMQNNPDVIAKLFECKADINVESGPDHGFATPLAMAMTRKKKKAMKKLKDLGALEKVDHEYEESSEGEFAPVGGGEYVPKVKGRLFA
mmetsp:Transcript_59316/g.138166  ORF Transcript_59316/g.138166 Transcript_59316/m.138166 type:complete len:480 (-) Transcript_59316:402-1841(-)